MTERQTIDFGYQQVPLQEKAQRVAGVFHSVAEKYDVMNDLMSLGLHRIWKRVAVELCQLRPGNKVLDLAGGTADLSLLMAKRVGDTGEVVLSDINSSMLNIGRDRVIDGGYADRITCCQINAEAIPFPDNTFDCITIGFGLRNVTQKDKALAEMARCLKPGGRLVVLEFSEVSLAPMKKIYDLYSFKLLPKLGEWIANDADSYQYLAESIRMHPNQETLKHMILAAGFDRCDVTNLNHGIVAIHRAYKF